MRCSLSRYCSFCNCVDFLLFSLSRLLLRTTKPMARLKQSQPDKYLKLEKMIVKPIFDPVEVRLGALVSYEGGSSVLTFDPSLQAYSGIPKEKRRVAIAQCKASSL